MSWSCSERVELLHFSAFDKKNQTHIISFTWFCRTIITLILLKSDYYIKTPTQSGKNDGDILKHLSCGNWWWVTYSLQKVYVLLHGWTVLHFQRLDKQDTQILGSFGTCFGFFYTATANEKLESHLKQFIHLLQFAIKRSQDFRFLDPAVCLADQLLVSDKHLCRVSPAHVLEMVEVSWGPLVLPEDVWKRTSKTLAFRE